MRVAVTGGSGFIGQRVCQKLAERGREVFMFSRSFGFDVRNPDLVDIAVRKCSRIIHLAGLVSFNSRDRDEVLRTNVTGTKLILEAAKRHNIVRTVVVSSAITCGDTDHPVELKEKHIERDIERDPYVESKLMVEELTRMVGGRVVTVAPSNCRFDLLVDRIDRPGVVFVPPGGCNMVDVDDVAEGIIAAMNKGIDGEKYLLSSLNLSYSYLYDAVRRESYCNPHFVHLHPYMRGTAAAAAYFSRDRFLVPSVVRSSFHFKYYSYVKALRDLGWSPKVGLTTSIRREIERRRLRGVYGQSHSRQ